MISNKSKQAATVVEVVAKVIMNRVDMVFGLIGNGNVDLISMLTSNKFPFTSMRHEVAIVTAADAYFRATGNTAVATTTYGAGFTNMITGLAEARLAGIPLVAVVGDAPSRGRRPFDIDQQKVAAGIGVLTLVVTKESPGDVVNRAFDLARDSQEPVLVLVPTDIVGEVVQERGTNFEEVRRELPLLSAEEIEVLAHALVQAERPLILSGGGVVRTETGHIVKELGDAVGAVFMNSMTASNVTRSPHSLGIAGGFTPEYKMPAVRAADLVLILGATSNDFQTRRGEIFATKNLYRIDLSSNWNHSLSGVHTVIGDLSDALPRLLIEIEKLAPRASGFRNEVESLVESSSFAHEPQYGTDGRLNPRYAVSALNSIFPANRQIVVDGGHFMSWVVERMDIPDPASFIGVGTAFQSIGLGFGSAAGASVGTPDRFTVCFSGDGGGQMALADLATFVEVTERGAVVVINDAAYGAEIHQYAVLGADPTAMYLPSLNFAEFGVAVGATGISINKMEDFEVLEEWIATGTGVAIVNINVSTEFAHPAVAPGSTG